MEIPEGFTKIDSTVSDETLTAPEGFTKIGSTIDYSELEDDIKAGRKPAWMLDWQKTADQQYIADRPAYEVNPDDLSPGFFETETGQAGGGIAGGIRGAKWGFQAAPLVAPVVGPLAKPLAAIGMGAVGAGLGGAFGEGVQQTWQSLTDNPYAPENWKDSAERIVSAGGEEALYDFVGSTVFKGVGGIWKFIRPKEIPGIEDVQKIIGEHGGQLTPSQRTNHVIVGGVEGLTEASWGGQPLRDVKKLNEDAIKSYTDEYVSRFTHIAGSELDDVGVGQLFTGVIESGQKAHAITAGHMYGSLDAMYKAQKTKVATSVPTGLVDTSGSIIEKTKIVNKILPPVPTKGIKAVVNEVIKIQDELANATMGDYGKQIVSSVSKISDDGLSFAAAQELRSGLLSNIRGLEGKLGEGKTKTLMGDLVSAVDDAIEAGANKTGNTEFIESWQSANKFWKEGKESLDMNILSSLMKKEPEKIGETIFAVGNVTKIKDARKALVRAVQYSQGKGAKGLTKEQAQQTKIVFSDTWKRMQGGYLTGLIGKVSDPKTGQMSIHNLMTHFEKGTKQYRTLKEAFSSAQRDGLRHFIDTVAAVQKRPPMTGSFMVTVKQAGLVMTLTGGAYAAGGGDIGDLAGEAAFLTITPYILSRLLVNPKYARLISRGLNMKSGGPASGAVAAKIAAAVADIQAISEPKKQGEE